MISSLPFIVKLLLFGAAMMTLAWLAVVLAGRVTRTWRSATVAGRTFFFIAAFVATLCGGDKHSSTNDASIPPPANLTTALHLHLPSAPVSFPSVAPEEIALGWQLWEVRTNNALDYAMPACATLATNWWLHGAFEDVRREGLRGLRDLKVLSGIEESWAFPLGSNEYDSVWAYTWGKIRPRLRDVSKEIVAVGAPMSAIPNRSRFWTAATTNTSYLLTWEDFAPGRIPNLSNPSNLSNFISAQIELFATGDFVTRSNEVERLYRRIDPEDWDGDGWRNEDDWSPYDWDDVCMPLYQELPPGANEDAYCWIEITTEWNGPVEFVGDGPSNLPDPCFDARAGETARVMLLIGKTYAVTSAYPIAVLARSDERIEIRDRTDRSFTVEWPVSIGQGGQDSSAPLLLTDSAPLLGARGNDGFTMSVMPDCLCGVFSWSTNGCCRIVGDDEWSNFYCAWDCQCGGCDLSGTYAYEGYSILFSGIECACHYDPDPQTTWSLSAPQVVFKNGALKPLSIQFNHGDPWEPEEGTLRLVQTSGSSKIRLWEDAGKTSEVAQFEWDVCGFDSCTYYIEGIETSTQVADIGFQLVWDRPGGSSAAQTGRTTCAEVEEVIVSSSLPNGSPNPPPFDGHAHYNFDVTHSPSTDKHWSVLFKDAVREDFTVGDFDVDMTLVVKPTGAPVGMASWVALEPTPQSGSIISKDSKIGALRNPKVGGVYHIGSAFDGSPTNECNIVLPLAGASMDGALAGDLQRADAFAIEAIAKYDKRERNSISFGRRWFVDGGNGDYLGRPDNALNPCVWYYSQVNDDTGMAGIGTLAGLPIRVAKLSNVVAAYTCERLEVSRWRQYLSQLIGTVFDLSALRCWLVGQDLANGADYHHTITNMVRVNWQSGDERTIKPWPNLAPVDNHSDTVDYSDFNFNFYSPGMLYKHP